MAKELYEDNLVFADTMNVLFFDREEKTDKTQSKTEVFSNQKYNRENHLLKSKNEFLSGIKKGETFTPVLTVVVYFMY